MNLTTLLGRFCKHKGLGPLVSDEIGLHRLVFDGRWSVDIQEQHENSPGFIISCVVGPVSATASPAVLRHCLGANLFARRANDAFVALDNGRDELVVLSRHHLAGLDEAGLEIVLRDFVDQVAYWNDFLQAGEPPTGDSLPADGAGVYGADHPGTDHGRPGHFTRFYG